MSAQRLKRLVAFASLVGALLAVACSSPAPTTGPGGGQAPADGPVKPKVDRLVIALKTPTNEGATPRHYCCFDAWQGRLMYESLVGQDVKTGLPGTATLATEWKIDEVANKVTFKLRPGVKFHGDNGEMTSKDVIHTLDTLKANEPPSSNTWVLSWWRPFIEKAEANGDAEVTFSITPQAQFMYFISDVFFQLPIRSKADHDKNGEPKTADAGGVAGTGPYQFKERKVSSYLRMERTPYKHWKATPDFPEVEFRMINEPSTRLAGLLAGEIHITDVPSDLQSQAEKQGMKRIANLAKSPRVMATFLCCYPDVQTNQWPLYPDSALLNIKVREALNRAINRDELGKAFAPVREPLFLSHYNEQRPAWDPAWPARFNDMYGFSPDKARALLAEAGYTAAKPLELDVYASQLTYIANGPDINDAIANYFRNVGIKVNVVQNDPGTQQTQERAYRFKNLVRLQSIGSNLLDGLIIWNTRGNGGSAAGYYTPELWAMRDELNKVMDPDKQVPHLKKIGEWGFSNYWDIPLWYVPLEVMANPKIVENWTYPGSANGGWSHFETIKAAR